jgi:hypothetical protein
VRGARFLVLGVFAAAFALLPIIALAVDAPTVASTPRTNPPATPIPTPRGSIFLNPGSATPAAKVTLSGSGLDPSAILHVLFDSNPTIDINTNGSGNFTAQLTVPDTAPAGTHQVCVGESNGNVCSAFTVEAASASTPSPSPSPSVSPSPSPSDGLITIASTAGGGTSPLALLIKPPFVFLPIIAAIALLAFLGIYLWRLRQAPPISEVTILHKAPEPRPYGQDPIPPPTPAPAPPAAPIVYESPSGPISAPPPARPPAAPNDADIPPEMPEASD